MHPSHPLRYLAPECSSPGRLRTAPGPGALAAILWILLGGGAAAQQPLWKLVGLPGDRAGSSLTSLPDIDGDGRYEVVVGAPLADDMGTQSGRARVFAGGTGLELFTFAGLSALDQLGQSMAYVGDADGDNLPDFVVGAPGGSFNGPSSGYAMVVSSFTQAALALHVGDNTDDRFGHAVGAAGDFDQDGRPDVIVGGFQADAGGVDAGVARVFSGRTAGLLATFQGHAAGDHFGISLAGVGDLDQDGWDDVAIGADQAGVGAGYVEVRSGRTKLVLFTFQGSTLGELFGSAVAAAGDVDGDGRPDVAVGAPLANSGDGRVDVFSGATGLVVLTVPGLAGANFGWSLAALGDVDGDGRDDVFAGAPLESSTGAAHVLSGADGTSLVTHLGESAGDRFGWSVASGGNLTLDLVDDLLIGAPRDDDGGVDSGTGYAIDGTDDPPVPPFPYCTAKVNSAGCGASVGFTGAPSASSPTPFDVAATSVVNQKPGVLFYGSGQATILFQGGTLCVQPPLGRSKVLYSAGNAGSPDCSGVLSFDMNAKIQSGTNPALVAGATIGAQFWYRDPGDAFMTGLSNALQFEIGF